MIVAFKKKHWDNDTYEPSDDDQYDSDESDHIKKDKNGKLVYQMPKGEKKDKDDKDCQRTKMYITLTNLLNPTVQFEPVPFNKTFDTHEGLLLTQVTDANLDANIADVAMTVNDNALYHRVGAAFLLISFILAFF
jgi:hypothetical protein